MILDTDHHFDRSAGNRICTCRLSLLVWLFRLCVPCATLIAGAAPLVAQQPGEQFVHDVLRKPADPPLIMLRLTEESNRMKGAAEIGQRIFLDSRLSEPPGMSCASCHDPRHAFTDLRAISPGASPGSVGIRNTPSLMYAALIPPRRKEQIIRPSGEIEMAWEGGLFLDGRARNLYEQVQGPLFASHEMNLPDGGKLAILLRKAGYAAELRKWVGEDSWKDDKTLNHLAFRALSEFLKEPMFRPFDARIDDYLAGDESALSDQEKRGLEVFKGAGKCADCHLLEAVDWPQPLLSDFGYDNLGVPSRGRPDAGLGGITGDANEIGQFRAPTLRNITLTPPYMHNGSIATLREVMEFYNKRDSETQRWGKTDHPQTVNHEDLGDLKLTGDQIDDLTSLMGAFTDRTLLLQQETGSDFPEAPEDVPPTRDVRIVFPDWAYHLRKTPSVAAPGR
jgi:cytochrome c peroxidase